MKKRILIFILSISFLLGMTACRESTSESQEQADRYERGNTTGNIINMGLAVEGDSWIYYIINENWVENSQKSGIYKMRNDGTEVQKIYGSENICYYEWLNVAEDWIYYVCSEQSAPFDWDNSIFGIYKIKTDGTEKTKIFDEYIYEMSVVGNWIYYIDYNENKSGIYRMRLDGSDITLIYKRDKEKYILDMNVIGDWIYFPDRVYDANDAGVNYISTNGIYKIRTDGSNQTLIYEHEVKSQRLYKMIISDDKIYVILDEFLKVFDLDGNEISSVSIDAVYMNIIEEWIYFSINDYENQSENGFYKMRNNGTELIKLSDLCPRMEINIVSDWIFFVPKGEEFPYRIRTDGTELQLVIPLSVIPEK